MTRKTGEAGRALIKEFEGLRLEAYQCQAGKWTIGWGHTRGVKRGDTITEAQAEDMLSADLEWAERAVDALFSVPLNDCQHGALVAWVFNVGEPAARASTLRRKLTAGHYDDVPGQLARWNKTTVDGQKVTSRGLVRRRSAEAALWSREDAPLPVERPSNPERSSPAKSKTMQAGAVGGGFLGVAIVDKLLDVDLDKAQGVLDALSSVDWQTVGILVGAGVAVAFMMSERLKAWAEGWT